MCARFLIEVITETLTQGVEETLKAYALERTRELLVPRVITGSLLKRLIKRAMRNGSWSKLPLKSRSLLRAASRLPRVKSPVLVSIIRELLLRLELATLRGRAVFYGVLYALTRGSQEALRSLKRLITLGVSYLNLPVWLRSLG